MNHWYRVSIPIDGEFMKNVYWKCMNNTLWIMLVIYQWLKLSLYSMFIEFECISAYIFLVIHINKRVISDPYILYYSWNQPKVWIGEESRFKTLKKIKYCIYLLCKYNLVNSMDFTTSFSSLHYIRRFSSQ